MEATEEDGKEQVVSEIADLSKEVDDVEPETIVILNMASGQEATDKPVFKKRKLTSDVSETGAKSGDSRSPGPPIPLTLQEQLEELYGNRQPWHRIKSKDHNEAPNQVRVFRGSAKIIRLLDGCGFQDWSWGDIILKEFITTSSLLNGRPRVESHRSDLEVGALRWLSKLDCEHAPTYIGSFRTYDALCDRKVHAVFMTKVEGVTLQDKWSVLPADERERVKEAFKTAVGVVHGMGVYNGSPHKGNIIWNEKENKCYIIDFERAQFDDKIEERRSAPEYWDLS